MKVPKSKTIRGKIYAYAYKVGLVVVHNSEETCNLFDIHVGYYTHKNVDMDTVVRVVTDELYARKFRQESEASLNVGA